MPHVDGLLPEGLRRAAPPRLPEVSEPEIVRHYVNLSKRNFDLDSGFYPLGSCTMKHNPRLHERVAALPGHARLHPLQDPRRAQGALELMCNLERALAEVAGLPHVSLQPSAGSHGELAGVLLTRAYHDDRGENAHKVLTPDTAHGTNPATVTMAGYEVVKVAPNADGGVDVDDLRAKADEDVACLMLTNPNTLGVFDPNIEEIAAIVHDVGATLYYDGANLNAVMGISRPGDMGFDIVHFNLHKSFTQPHGGGGPGSGPIAVSDRIEPYLPRPQVVRSQRPTAGRDLRPRRRTAPKSIGRLRGFQGNYGVLRALLRLHPLARRRGPEGRQRDRGAQRQLPARAAARARRRAPAARLRRALHARVRARRRADEAGARDPDARPRQAAARPRLPPADGLLPAARRRGAAGRADRDRDARDARRLRRGDRRDPRARPPRTPRSPRTRRTRRRCAASTRPAPRSARACARPCSAHHETAAGRWRDWTVDCCGRARGPLPSPAGWLAAGQSRRSGWWGRSSCSSARPRPRPRRRAPRATTPTPSSCSTAIARPPRSARSPPGRPACSRRSGASPASARGSSTSAATPRASPSG